MSVRGITTILFLACATSLSAQTPVRTTLDAARAGNWYVRIGTSAADTVFGRITRVHRDSLTLARTQLALDDVASLDRRIRRGSGALPTGLFGAAVLGLLGAGLAGLCESDCEYAWVGPMAGGAAAGMALGSVMGAVVAPGRIEWRRVYPPIDSAHVRENAQVAQQPDDRPYAGGGVTFMFGTGWSIENVRYRLFRLGLQLSGTTNRVRPVETTGEFQLIGADGAAVFYAGGGANVMWERGIYAGPVLGFIFSDGPIPTVSLRAGWRPRSSGLRPEVRADYLINEGGVMLVTLGVGLEVH